MEKKKLQVFVSSTYTDMKDERQAAVMAILRAGHIPAGMELFAAGDNNQMEVIHKWINQCDVFCLLLGHRYGTIEQESQKSYIHLEYEYARSKKIAFFALVINEEYIENKIKAFPLSIEEKKRRSQYETFKEEVSSKMVTFWSNEDQITLGVMTALYDSEEREELVGWVKRDQKINIGLISEQLARLSEENQYLREQLKQYKGKDDPKIFSGLSFTEMKSLLEKKKYTIDDSMALYYQKIEDSKFELQNDEMNLVVITFAFRHFGVFNMVGGKAPVLNKIISDLLQFNILERQLSGRIMFSETGSKFNIRLAFEIGSKNN